MIQLLNVAKWQIGMEEIPTGKVFIFSDALKFDSATSVYTDSTFGNVTETPKITFNVKASQVIPKKDQENWNINFPELIEGHLT